MTTSTHYDFSKLSSFARGEAIINLILESTQDFAKAKEMMIDQIALIIAMKILSTQRKENKDFIAPIKCVQFEYDIEGKVCGAKHRVSSLMDEEILAVRGMIAARELAWIAAERATA